MFDRIFLSIVKKEFLHVVRDWQTLVIIIVMPVLMLLLFGYAITLEMRQITIALVDHSRSPESRAFLERIRASDFFEVAAVNVPEAQFERLFQERRSRCILVIPHDFARSLEQDAETDIQLLIDASDPNAANYIQKYLMQVSTGYDAARNPSFTMPLRLEPRLLYNPDLRSEYFFVPGLIAVIILLISALLTSIAIVREKEVGTMEQILVSPAHPVQIILGKVVPFIVLGFVDSVLILVIGHFWFGVPIHGSVVFLGLSLILYIFTGLSFGLLISTVANTQRLAMMATLLATILPTIMLSGFIFPIPSMPVVFQYVSRIVPATHFLRIIRGIMLKGSGVRDLVTPITYLLVLSIVLITVSVRKFNTRLE
ncbi:MAG TPA: ABC transporter permease [Patescibacteria group bacterium]|nr:ABC transporter permease [Patescibacteria group bacterium]